MNLLDKKKQILSAKLMSQSIIIMSSQFGFIDIILLAMFAGFIILRLRNILGRRSGHE